MSARTPSRRAVHKPDTALLPTIVAAPPIPPILVVFADTEGAIHLMPAADVHMYWMRGSTTVEHRGRHYQSSCIGVHYLPIGEAFAKYNSLVEGAASQPPVETP